MFTELFNSLVSDFSALINAFLVDDLPTTLGSFFDTFFGSLVNNISSYFDEFLALFGL